MQRIVVLISGRGSNLEAIVRQCQAEDWPARVVAVISHKADAAGLSWAQGQGIGTAVVDHRAHAPLARMSANASANMSISSTVV